MFDTVARSLYDDAIADRRRAEDRLAASVPISVHSEAIKRLSDALDKAMASAGALSTEIASMKRHDIGLHQKDFDASVHDPMHTLGPKTQLAIDEFAGGDPSVRQYLIGRAALEQAALRVNISDPAQLDEELAAMIRDGDQ